MPSERETKKAVLLFLSPEAHSYWKQQAEMSGNYLKPYIEHLLERTTVLRGDDLKSFIIDFFDLDKGS